MQPVFIYILSNAARTMLQVRSTTNLSETFSLTKPSAISGFRDRSGPALLVYLETCPDPDAAFIRERCLKRKRNRTKWALIKSCNPELREMKVFARHVIFESRMNAPF